MPVLLDSLLILEHDFYRFSEWMNIFEWNIYGIDCNWHIFRSLAYQMMDYLCIISCMDCFKRIDGYQAAKLLKREVWPLILYNALIGQLSQRLAEGKCPRSLAHWPATPTWISFFRNSILSTSSAAYFKLKNRNLRDLLHPLQLPTVQQLTSWQSHINSRKKKKQLSVGGQQRPASEFVHLGGEKKQNMNWKGFHMWTKPYLWTSRVLLLQVRSSFPTTTTTYQAVSCCPVNLHQTQISVQ